MSIELQSDFPKGKSGNISSDKLTDCTRSVDAKISNAGLNLEQNEDQAQQMKSRVQVQSAQVQYSSRADQVQCTRAEVKSSWIRRRPAGKETSWKTSSVKNQLDGDQLVETSPEFSNQLTAKKKQRQAGTDLYSAKSTKPAEALNAKDTKYNQDRNFSGAFFNDYTLCVQRIKSAQRLYIQAQ
ncbi:zinc finger CCCH domain-containing protein 44-like [Dorcoceras hygrometricum]|uniref:Zinc finger CCCH domain-containing protein 44-like n=1 Tax=Dorcoceras hygrometricum TaxID=472368 RepID=A0A2Z7A8L9_9LAMI|nr:zinc finger CCCH domain-containing protein 44-like [Dorcoceras hygrometricum]